MLIQTDCAATLGSQFNLVFDPHGKRVYQNSGGGYPGRPLELNASVELSDGRELSLPFKEAGVFFDDLEYFPSLTGFTYRGVRQDMGIELALSVRAPFYPHDAKLSTAPFYFLKLTVRYLQKEPGSMPENVRDGGRLVMSLNPGKAECRGIEDGLEYKLVSTSELREQDRVTDEKAYETISCLHGTDAFEVDEKNRIYIPFNFSDSDAQSLGVLWSAWHTRPVLEVKGEPAAFKYREFFDSEPKMVEWALENRTGIEEKCNFLDVAYKNSSLGTAISHFSALALHSFLANTWWATLENGSDWFSVWEGTRYYHSGIDVEYNCALFYLNLWPELLDRLLCQWAELEVEPKEKSERGRSSASFLCRDMGMKHRTGRQAYPHYMQIEANADYLLLMAARTFFSGELKLMRKYLPLCRRLAEFIIASDKNGNGFPVAGTANTIDDAGAAMQYSGAQTYLAVKAQAALWALGELEELAGKEACKSGSERWKAFVAKSVKTLCENAWLKDHYAVSLSRSTEGMVNPHTGEQLPPGELQGWDDYSIYTANGLLYLFVANIKMPRWNHMHLILDMETADTATRTEYGNAHAGREGGNVRFSQNLWRDYVAAYYGVDFLGKVEEYRDYQQLTRVNSEPDMYRDSTVNEEHRFSPRGVAVFGAPMAAAGLRINRVQEELHLAPLRRTLRVPLLALADWKAMRMPWIIADTREGITCVRITERDLLDKFKVYVIGAELEDV